MFLTDIEATLEAIRCRRTALEADVVFMKQFNADRLANGMSPGYDANCHEEQLGRLEEGALLLAELAFRRHSLEPWRSDVEGESE